MRQLSQIIVGASLVALLLALPMLAQEPGPAAPDLKPAALGTEVTLTGMMMNDWVCTRNLAMKNRPAEMNVPVIFALDAAPDVSAAFKDIFKELIAGNSINYDQAKTIEDEMNGRKLRLPGEDEWDYVAKVGTSNPPFAKKYKALVG